MTDRDPERSADAGEYVLGTLTPEERRAFEQAAAGDPGLRAEQQRRELLGARLLLVEGALQDAEGVIHVVAERVRDCSRWLGELRAPSRDFH